MILKVEPLSRLFGRTNTSVLNILKIFEKMDYQLDLWITSGVYDKDLIKQIPNTVNIVYGRNNIKDRISELLRSIRYYSKRLNCPIPSINNKNKE